MPFDPSGNHSLPGGTIVTVGDKVLPSQHNPFAQDASASLSMVLVRDGRAPMIGNLPMNGNRITGMAPAESSTDGATLGQARGAGVPVGTVLDYAGRSLPAGFLWPDGRAVLRATYPELDSAIYAGDSNNATAEYGYRATTAVNPSDNRSTSGAYIVLPDLRGVVVVGRANMGGTLRAILSNFAATIIGSFFGTQDHVLTAAQMPAHGHTGTAQSAGAHTHNFTAAVTNTGMDAGSASRMAQSGTGTTSSAGAHTHTLSINDSGGGEAHPNVQPSIILNKIIKASN